MPPADKSSKAIPEVLVPPPGYDPTTARKNIKLQVPPPPVTPDKLPHVPGEVDMPLFGSPPAIPSDGSPPLLLPRTPILDRSRERIAPLSTPSVSLNERGIPLFIPESPTKPLTGTELRDADTLAERPISEDNTLPYNISPTFFLHAWKTVEDMGKQISVARGTGYNDVMHALRLWGVVAGHITPEEYEKDQHTPLDAQNLQHNEDRSRRYVPWLSDIANLVGSSLPYIEISTAAGFLGGAAGGAIGAVAGAPLGLGAGATAAAGAAIGANASIWAANTAIDAGTIYKALRDAKANHTLARNIALSAAPFTGLTSLLNVQLANRVFRNTFRQVIQSRLASQVIKPFLSHIYATAGVAGAATATNQAIREFAQEIAAFLDKEVPHPTEWANNVATAFLSGAFMGGVFHSAVSTTGWSIEQVIKGMRAVRNAVDAVRSGRPIFQTQTPPLPPTEAQLAEEAAALLVPPRTTSDEARLAAGARLLDEYRNARDALIREFSHVDPRILGVALETNRFYKLRPSYEKPTDAQIRAIYNYRMALTNWQLQLIQRRLENLTVIGDARRKLEAAKAHVLTTRFTTGMAGFTEDQFAPPGMPLNVLQSPTIAFARNLNAMNQPYREKWAMLASRTPDADRLAQDFDITPHRAQFDEVNRYLHELFLTTMQNQLGLSRNETIKTLLKTRRMKVKFTYRSAAPGVIRKKGAAIAEEHPYSVETFEGTYDEAIQRCLQLFDYDLQLGLVEGNRFTVSALDPNSMLAKLLERLSAYSNFRKLANGYLEFYKMRRPLVSQLITLYTGRKPELSEKYSGYALRLGYADWDLDFEKPGVIDAWMTEYFRPVPSTLHARNPESKLGIRQTSALENALVSNTHIARVIAYASKSKIDNQVLKMGQISNLTTRIFRNEQILKGLSNHLRDITYQAPEAQIGWAKYSLKILNRLYDVWLLGDLNQYNKQLTGVLAALSHTDPLSFIEGLIRYHSDYAYWDEFASRSREVQDRYSAGFRSMKVGVLMQAASLQNPENIIQKLMAAPLTDGDRATTAMVFTIAYTHGRRRGLSSEEAIREAERIVHLTQSTSKVEYLPSWSRDKNWKGFAAFSTQPILLAARVTLAVQRLLNQRGWNQMERAQALTEAASALLGAKLSVLLYSAVAIAGKMLVDKAFETEDGLIELFNTVITEPGIPIVQDTMRLALITIENSLLGAKQRVWEITSPPLDAVMNTIRFMGDLINYTTGAQTESGQPKTTEGDLADSFSGSLFNVYTLKLPKKLVSTIIKLLKEERERLTL